MINSKIKFCLSTRNLKIYSTIAVKFYTIKEIGDYLKDPKNRKFEFVYLEVLLINR